MNWVEHFGVSSEQLEAWRMEAPEGTPLLFWCLMEAKIPFTAYREWAREHFGIVTLKPQFFENTSNFNVSSMVDPSGSWAPWHVPLAVWEGSTFVGCVEPPSDNPENFVYVLASPVELNEFYKVIFSTTTITTAKNPEAPAAIPDAPEGLNIQVSTKKFIAPEGLSLESPPPVPVEMPTGMPELPEMTSVTNITPSQEPATNTTHTVSEVSAIQVPPALNDLEGWWQDVQKKFRSCLILCGDRNHLKLIWHNGAPVSGAEVPLNQPSLFRITVRTQKPYHGFVVENEVHKAFFASLGMSTFPQNVTAITTPLPDEQILVVLYFGFIEEDQSQELAAADGLTDKFSTSNTTAFKLPA